MEINREPLRNALNEVEALLLDYFARTNAQEGQPQLDMDWHAFLRIEENGKLMLMTAREDVELRGFAVYVFYPHLHHAHSIWAMCDILAVDPDHRGKGIATAIVQAAMTRFKVMGIDQIVHGFRTVYDTTPLFEKLGFTCIEHIYRKAL